MLHKIIVKREEGKLIKPFLMCTSTVSFYISCSILRSRKSCSPELLCGKMRTSDCQLSNIRVLLCFCSVVYVCHYIVMVSVVFVELYLIFCYFKCSFFRVIFMEGGRECVWRRQQMCFVPANQKTRHAQTHNSHPRDTVAPWTESKKEIGVKQPGYKGRVQIPLSICSSNYFSFLVQFYILTTKDKT